MPFDRNQIFPRKIREISGPEHSEELKANSSLPIRPTIRPRILPDFRVIFEQRYQVQLFAEVCPKQDDVLVFYNSNLFRFQIPIVSLNSTNLKQKISFFEENHFSGDLNTTRLDQIYNPRKTKFIIPIEMVLSEIQTTWPSTVSHRKQLNNEN